mmetsp:Transcript_18158/g.22014  ORF Transcript_18158/g.22014 Transcript_18158/m.22014 type:complete len:426 (-) Transcript_18158:22-1299(-)
MRILKIVTFVIALSVCLTILFFTFVCLGSSFGKDIREGPILKNVFLTLREPSWTYYEKRIQRSSVYLPLKRRIVTREEKRTFETDGVVLVSSVLDASEYTMIEKAGKKFVQMPSLTCILAQIIGVGGYFLKYEAFCQHPRTIESGLQKVATESAIAHVAHQFLKTQNDDAAVVRLLRDTIMVAGNRLTMNWHIDRPVFFNGTKGLIVWCPSTFINGNENGLLFINGSNHAFAQTNIDHFPRIMPTIRKFAQRNSQIIAPNLKPGDCLFFQDTTVHSAIAGERKNDKHRVAYQLRFFLSDLQQAPKKKYGQTWAFHPLDTFRALSRRGRPTSSWSFIYPAFLFDNYTNLSQINLHQDQTNLPAHATLFEWMRFTLSMIPRYFQIVYALTMMLPLDIPHFESSYDCSNMSLTYYQENFTNSSNEKAV